MDVRGMFSQCPWGQRVHPGTASHPHRSFPFELDEAVWSPCGWQPHDKEQEHHLEDMRQSILLRMMYLQITKRLRKLRGR